MSEKLPPLCSGTDHQWSDMSGHGCGASSGDQAGDEGIVLATYVHEPRPGDTCYRCFQIFGQPVGVRNEGVVAVLSATSAW